MSRRTYPTFRCSVCNRRLERLSGASWKTCPDHPTAKPKQEHRDKPRTYQSDALGAVTIPEDDNRPTWDSRCEHGSVDPYACSICYYDGPEDEA